MADLKLIDMPIEQARRAKWLLGRAKFGAEFVGDPLEELNDELLDGMNYVDEAESRGIALPGMRDTLRRLCVAVRQVRFELQTAATVGPGVEDGGANG